MFYIKFYLFILFNNLFILDFWVLLVLLSISYYLILFLGGSYLGIFGLLSFLLLYLIIYIYILLYLILLFIKSKGFLLVNTNLYFLDLGYTNLEWSFSCDTITLSMFFVVLIISNLVQMYSIFYMRYDPHIIRFFSLLNLFTFCMLILVSSNNIIQLFFGWEGVGICSYLLVNFWFTRIQANKSAIKAMLMNRIGDISLLMFIVLFFYLLKSFDFYLLNLMIYSYIYSYFTLYLYNIHIITIFAFFIFLAVMGKSAQLGLHTWLPDAMEGPTPVSALIHAATMVTAGVFLIIRCYYIYELSFLKLVVLILGSLTALFGSLTAVLQNDIKKVIAYSTCSQLGYMVVACGLSRYDLALFHLLNHAFFKALLFLSAGVILHSIYDEQDMRRMGGLLNFLPFTYICVFLASYALMGLPFLSGFYSKDLILELSFFYFDINLFFIFIIILISAFFTAFYSYRLLYYTFYQKPKGFFFFYKNIIEGDLVILYIFFFLSLLSIFSGYLFKEFFIGFGSDFLYYNLNVYLYNFIYDYEYIFFFIKLIPLIFSLFGIYLAYMYLYINVYKYIKNKLFLNFYYFIFNKWYFDYIYIYYIINNFLFISYNITYKIIDKNLLEILGVNGIYYFVFKLSYLYKKIYNNYIYIYILLFIFGLIFLLSIFYINYISIYWLYIYSIIYIFYKNKQIKE